MDFSNFGWRCCVSFWSKFLFRDSFWLKLFFICFARKMSLRGYFIEIPRPFLWQGMSLQKFLVEIYLWNIFGRFVWEDFLR